MKPSTADVILDWPIDIEGGAQIAKLVVRRPKGKTIKKLIALIGPDIVASLLSDRESFAKDTTRFQDRLMRELASFATIEKLDGLTAIVADMTGQKVAIIDELDPEDFPKIWAAVIGFFPSLISSGDPTPPT